MLLLSGLVFTKSLSAQIFLFTRLSEFQNLSIDNSKQQTQFLVTDTGNVILSQRTFDKKGFLSKLDSFAVKSYGLEKLLTKRYEYIETENRIEIKTYYGLAKEAEKENMYFDSTGILTKWVTSEKSGAAIIQEYKKSEYGVYASVECYRLMDNGQKDHISSDKFEIYDNLNWFSVRQSFEKKHNVYAIVYVYDKDTGRLEKIIASGFNQYYVNSV